MITDFDDFCTWMFVLIDDIWQLCARLYTKLPAHTRCLYVNRLPGNPDWLQIKALAFPNTRSLAMFASRNVKMSRAWPPCC